MIRFLSNAHTHSTFGDGVSTLAQQVSAAQRLGFVSLGFSEHAAQGFDPEYSMSLAVQDEYFAQVRELASATEDLRIRCGLELDTMAHESEAQASKRDADYLIGSTHYLSECWHGQPVSVDGDFDLLTAYCDAAYAGDGLAMAMDYLERHAEGVLHMKPQIIGHFDLVRKYAASRGLFDEASPKYRRAALTALERVYPSGGVLEVNTGAIARGAMTLPYPTFELLCAWREMGGSVTLTSDCHNAAMLNCYFGEALSMIRQAGFKQVLYLGCGKALWDSLDL